MSWMIIIAWVMLLLKPIPVLGVSFEDLAPKRPARLLGEPGEVVLDITVTCGNGREGVYRNLDEEYLRSWVGHPLVGSAFWTEKERDAFQSRIRKMDTNLWTEEDWALVISASGAGDSEWFLVVDEGEEREVFAGGEGEVYTRGSRLCGRSLYRNFSDPWLDLRLRNGVSVSGTVHRVGETGIHEVRELVSQGLPVPLAVALAMTGFGVSRRLFYEIVGGEAEFQAAERRRELELMGYDESSYETLGLAGAIVAGEATEEEIARFRELQQEAAPRASLRKKAGQVLREAEPVSEPSAWDREDARNEDFRSV